MSQRTEKHTYESFNAKTVVDFEQRTRHNEAGYINFDNTIVDVAPFMYFPLLKISSFLYQS
jgi:hypothetical protein